MMTPLAFARDYITRWEGSLSIDPADNGNWSGGKRGAGSLIGSNHGVTPIALASHRKVGVSAITREAMAALTLDEAGQIALLAYYFGPKLDRLPWSQWTASVLDMAWGAGPVQAIKLLQRQVGSDDDGKIGPATVAAVNAYLLKHGVEACAWQFAFIRARFYATITASTPTNLRYINGWNNRSAYFTPADSEGWWARFAA